MDENKRVCRVVYERSPAPRGQRQTQCSVQHLLSCYCGINQRHFHTVVVWGILPESCGSRAAPRVLAQIGRGQRLRRGFCVVTMSAFATKYDGPPTLYKTRTESFSVTLSSTLISPKRQSFRRACTDPVDIPPETNPSGMKVMRVGSRRDSMTSAASPCPRVHVTPLLTHLLGVACLSRLQGA